MLQFYGYKKCGTSRKAEKHLESLQREYEFTDITLNPPNESELKKLILQSNQPIKKFLNTSGVQYKELNMKEKVKEISEEELIKLLSSNGKLLKRPIVTDSNVVTVGYNEENFNDSWGK